MNGNPGTPICQSNISIAYQIFWWRYFNIKALKRTECACTSNNLIKGLVFSLLPLEVFVRPDSDASAMACVMQVDARRLVRCWPQLTPANQRLCHVGIIVFVHFPFKWIFYLPFIIVFTFWLNCHINFLHFMAYVHY